MTDNNARPLVAMTDGVPEFCLALLAARYAVFDARGTALHALPDALLARIQGLAATSRARVDEALLARMPALRVIAAYSAGIDSIDLAAAARRGIPVSNTSDVVAEEVADTALGLTLMLLRGLARAEAYLRAGNWPAAPFPTTTSIARKRVGIIGLGRIGSALARRLAVMGAEIGYTGRAAKPERREPFLADTVALAAWSDILIATCSGGPATRHLVNAPVLRALGPTGHLVNVARGSVVDEPALRAALATHAIAGAALDVFENEPAIDPAWLALPNLVLTPHLGSGSIETRQAMADAMLARLAEMLPPSPA